MKYKNWTTFLDEHCAILRVSRRQASLDMGFSAGYLEGIEKGRFGASRERCFKIAEYFDVDPNEVLALAELYIPPEETETISEIVAEVNNLSMFNQRFLLRLARALKLIQKLSRQPQPSITSYCLQRDDDALHIYSSTIDLDELEEILRQILRWLYL